MAPPSSSSSQIIIIRIPRTDEEGSFVLGQVSPTGTGSKPLNLKLVATEGEEPYVVKLKHDRIGDLRVSNSPCSPAEWESILKAVLLNQGEPVAGIEAGAEARTAKSITITVRRRIAGINQRLGSIILGHSPDEGVELFDWCGAAVAEREKFRGHLAAETARAADLEARVAELRGQLNELTLAKQAREKEILDKMCRLLNEKKVKIREQQRLLNNTGGGGGGRGLRGTGGGGAGVGGDDDGDVDMESVKVEEEEEGEELQTTRRRVPAASRPGKRKTRRGTAGDVDSDDDSDGFAKMDVDRPEEGPSVRSGAAAKEVNNGDDDESAEEDRMTPDEYDEDDETGSEEEDEVEPTAPPPPKSELRKTTPAATGASSHHATRGKGKETVAVHTRSKASSPPASSAPADTPAEGSETDSDDEL